MPPETVRNKAVLGAATEATFESSLAMQVLRLFAAAARAGGETGASKRAFVRNYYEHLYPQDISNWFLERFDDYLERDPGVGAVTARLNERLTYQEKLFSLLKIYEFIISDEATEGEIEEARSIAMLLHVEYPDILFIEQSLGLGEPDPEILKTSNVIALTITDAPETGDLYLPLPGLDLVIYKMQNLYCITQKNESHPVTVGNEPVTTNIASRITQNFYITIGDYPLKYQDLKVYFENKVNPLRTRMYVAQDDLDLRFSQEQPADPVVRLDVKGSHLVINPLDELSIVAVNKERAESSTHVNLEDSVYVNGYRLNLREAFYYLNAKKSFRLDPECKTHQITNDIRGDVFIHDDLAAIWAATLTRENGKLYFEAGNCPYQVYLDSRLLTGRAEIRQGGSLFIHDNFLTFDLEAGVVQKNVFNFRKLVAGAIRYTFDDGTTGLDDVSFDIEYGELVCIMGPSGSGKSTLLNILSGLYKPDLGTVNVDQYDLTQQYGIMKDFLGYVPQDDLLLPNLTVFENLYYHARLRFPDKSHEELNAKIDVILEDINLADKKGKKVGQPTDKTLSGGERKRLNIGLELLADAEIYFLDEPTSGLSSKDSEKILDLLANISLRGKIVIAVIHQPGSKLYKMFQKVILLDNGGKMAYYGSAYAALEYFKRHLEANVGMGEVEVECPHCHTVQPGVLLDSLEESLKDIDGSTLSDRKYTPDYWKREYRRSVVASWFSNIKLPTSEILPPAREVTRAERFSQFLTLFSRNYRGKIRDRSNLLITFFEAPFLGAGIGFILRYSPFEDYTLYTNDLLKTFLFVAVIVAVFLSMTNSVDEIINDTPLFLRERMLNTTHRGYLASKILVLMLFAVIQNSLFVAASFLILEIRELFFAYIFYLSLLSYVGLSIGLFISAVPRLSSKAALNIVPLILIPQIILGGALIEYEKMNVNLTLFQNSPIPEIGQLMPSRWGYEGLMVLQESYNSYDAAHERYTEELKDFKYRHEAIIALEGKKAYEKQLQEMTSRLEKFRDKYKHAYGNKNIHDAVVLGEKKYEQEQKGEQDDDAAGKRDYGLLKELGLIYPLFVRDKNLAFTRFMIPTPVYNMIVLVTMALILNLFTLAMLRYRERMLWSVSKVVVIAGKAAKRRLSSTSRGQ